MALRLRNRWKYEGGDWWAWEAFLDDDGSGELKKVNFVEYVLHPTFPKPIRRVDNPRGGFVLETGGWGDFTLKAFAHMKDGTKKKLEHDLQLYYEPKKGVSD
jgi:transcription initiation factor IIF auxiliary subunit